MGKNNIFESIENNEIIQEIAKEISKTSKNFYGILKIALQCYTKTIQLKLDKYCNELANQSTINIKVNPEFIKLLQNNELTIDSNEPQLINLIPDEALKPVECIIDSDDHIIDAKFQTQISQIINQISK